MRPFYAFLCVFALMLAACSGGGSSSTPSAPLISGIGTGQVSSGGTSSSVSSNSALVTYVASGTASAGCGSTATPTPTAAPTSVPSGARTVSVNTCPALPAGTVLYTISLSAGSTGSGTNTGIINYFASGIASAGCGSSATPTVTAPPSAVPAPGTNVYINTCPALAAGTFLSSYNPATSSSGQSSQIINYYASGSASAGCGSNATPTPTFSPGTAASGGSSVTINTCPAYPAGTFLYSVSTGGGSTGSNSNTGILNYFADGQASAGCGSTATPTPTAPPSSAPVPGTNVYIDTCPALPVGTYLSSQNTGTSSASPSPSPTPTATSSSSSSSPSPSASATAAATSTATAGAGVSIGIPTPQPSSTASPTLGTPFFQNGAGFGNCTIGATFTTFPATATLSVTESGYSGIFTAVSTASGGGSGNGIVSALYSNNVITLQANSAGSVTVTVTDANLNATPCNVNVN